MEAFTDDTILELVKSRMDRGGMQLEASLEKTLRIEIEAGRQRLKENGIKIDITSASDAMLLVDLVVWSHSNRDKESEMPKWLKLKRRERWLMHK